MVDLTEQAHQHALPEQALQHIVSAGALQYLPEPVEPTITHDTGDIQAVFGQDGVTDIFVVDANNLGSETDTLVNWDPGEDMLAIVNFDERSDVVGLKINVKTGATWLNINDIDVAYLGVPTGDIFPMISMFGSDPFALI